MCVHSFGLQMQLLNFFFVLDKLIFSQCAKSQGMLSWMVNFRFAEGLHWNTCRGLQGLRWNTEKRDLLQLLFCPQVLTLNASKHWGPGQIWIESSTRASRKLRMRMSLLQKIWKFVHLYFHLREQTLNLQMKTCHLHWAQISKPRSHYLEICEAKGLR